MNGSLVISAIRKLSTLFVVGLFGYFVGLRGGEGQRAVGLKPVNAICSSVQPSSGESSGKSNGTNHGKETVGERNIEGESPKIAKPVSAEKDLESEEIAESQDIEQRIRGALSADEFAVVQASEQLPVPASDAESTGGVAEHIRALTAEKQLKYVKALADHRDDASIDELKGLITFDDDAVRHTAIDTLINIMDQETGHYGAVQAALADNAVFLDEGQMEKFNKISSRVMSRGAKENPAPTF